MKEGLLIATWLVAQIALGQPRLKIYGYSQVTTAGMIPGREARDENGKPVGRPASVINYYIYVASSPAVKVQPGELFIKGQWYAVASSTLVKAPIYAEQPIRRLLVSPTRLSLFQIELGGPIKKKSVPQSVKDLGHRNEVILAFSWKGRRYYQALKKITVLDPLHGL